MHIVRLSPPDSRHQRSPGTRLRHEFNQSLQDLNSKLNADDDDWSISTEETLRSIQLSLVQDVELPDRSLTPVQRRLREALSQELSKRIINDAHHAHSQRQLRLNAMDQRESSKRLSQKGLQRPPEKKRTWCGQSLLPMPRWLSEKGIPEQGTLGLRIRSSADPVTQALLCPHDVSRPDVERAFQRSFRSMNSQVYHTSHRKSQFSLNRATVNGADASIHPRIVEPGGRSGKYVNTFNRYRRGDLAEAVPGFDPSIFQRPNKLKSPMDGDTSPQKNVWYRQG